MRPDLAEARAIFVHEGYLPMYLVTDTQVTATLHDWRVAVIERAVPYVKSLWALAQLGKTLESGGLT